MCKQDLHHKEIRLKEAINTAETSVLIFATNIEPNYSQSVASALPQWKVMVMASMTAILSFVIFILFVLLVEAI